MTHYIPENNVYVYFRYDEKETVMVIINNAAEAKNIKTNRFQENIQSFKSGKDVLSGKTVDVSSEISLEGKSVMILELR
jgi:predicted GTPase